jgi:DNA-binding CsgD family transcriptional regulator
LPEPIDNTVSCEEAGRGGGAAARRQGEQGAAMARQLNGSLTALLIYMEEIKQHSHQFSGDRLYLQKVIDNALQQTERICELVKQIAGLKDGAGPDASVARGCQERPARCSEDSPALVTVAATDTARKPLTRREREVLQLISEGCSNKEGALRMQISPRTFESHRAEAMRKLGARNTADLVRAALLHSVVA